jgi:type IV pilus assembly protein PilM
MESHNSMAVLSTLQHIFPPPRYISFPSVGVDISDTSLKYVQFERARSHDLNLHLKAWGDIDIPDGVLERGNVHDVGKLTEVLMQVKAVTESEYVCVSLPEERAYLFETTIARDTHHKDIRGILEFKLEENVPLSPRDAYFDYTLVESSNAGGDARVAVAVYSRDTINAYHEACTKAGLMPIAFEIEAEAIARASVSKLLNGTYLIVDFGKTRLGVGIVHKGALMYTSTVEIAGRDMSTAMREILGNRPEAELTEIKNTCGLIKTKDNEAVARILQGFASNMADELGIRIHYWHTRDIDRKEREIKKIILCGGSSNLLGLPEFLSDKLCIPTERAQVWQNAFSLESFIPPITRKYSYGYATAIGLALREFVNPL